MRRPSFRVLIVCVLAACKSSESTAPAPVASVAVSPALSTVIVGETVQLTAQLRDASNASLGSRTTTWASSNLSVATVSATGLVTTVDAGTTNITATSEGKSGLAIVSAKPAVATVVLAPAAISIGTGNTFQLVAEARSAQGELLTDRTVAWSSNTPTVASVSSAGVITALSIGTTTISVTIDSRTATATVNVGAPVATVAISPPSVSLGAGATSQLVATPRDAQGNALTGRFVSWVSTNSQVASVSSTGLVTAVSVGTGVVTAAIEGRTATASVAVRPGDIAVQGAQLSQAVQADDGSLPMVSGRAAALTVLLSSRVQQAVAIELVLRLTNAANVVEYSDTLRRTVTVAPNPTSFTSSAQFLIPATHIRAGLRWQIIRDPRGLVPDDSAANDVFPRNAPASFAVADVPPLLLRFVPLQLAMHGNVTGNVTNGNVDAYLYMVRRLLPLSQITVAIAPPFSSNVSFGAPPSGGAVEYWTGALQELDLARVTSGGAPSTHWYGIMVPPAGFNFTAFGGYAYIPFSGSASGAGSRTALSVQVGWFSNVNLARDNIAHELGHNFGRRHAPCGGAASPDPAFPVTGGATGAVGFDVFAWSSGASFQAVAMAATYGDIMGYCAPVWIGPYNYGAVLNFRGTTTTAVRSVAPVFTRALIVRGRVTRGALSLEPAFTADALVEPDVGGTHRVEVLDAEGRVMLTQPFTPARLDHTDDVQLFTVPVIVDSNHEAAVRAIRVVGGGGSVARTSTATTFSALRIGTGAVTARRVSTTQVSLSCPTRDAAGAMVRDALTGELLGVARGPDVSVSAVPGRTLSVLCSDGVRQEVMSVRSR